MFTCHPIILPAATSSTANPFVMQMPLQYIEFVIMLQYIYPKISHPSVHFVA